MPRRVCLAIGVSNVAPRFAEGSRFAYLDGAPLAAEAIGEWTRRSGFGEDNVKVITDAPLPDGRPNPVTAARLQAAVNALFPDNGVPTDQLILTFCGHGMTADFGSAFWLFSDALEQQYRVNVDGLISELLTFGVKRISLISDACRDTPKGLDLTRLDSNRGILGRGTPTDSPMFDRLAACQDGQRAYMVVDPTTAAPGKCILSGVVLDVLWGNEPDAFENNIIDTHSFGIFTRDRASERATRYGLKLRPQCTVDPEAVLLVDGAAKPAPVPVLPPWPPAGRATSMGAIEDAISVALPQEGTFELLRADETFRDSLLGHNFGTSHPDLDPATGFTGLPEDARDLVDHLVVLRQLQSTTDLPVEADISSTISALEGEAAVYARGGAADMLRMALDKLHTPDALDGVNLIVSGADVRSIWSERRGSAVPAAGTDTYFRIGTRLPHLGAQIIVEFEDGAFVPVHLYPRLCAVVVRNPNGVAAVAYTSDDNEVLSDSALVIDELVRGELDSTRIESLAARIRRGKHANPILGAIAAYLYRQIADFDNLRRMAYYYVEHRQPIPFDIALLGQMDVYAEGDTYFVRVPAVPPRKPSGAERIPLPNYAVTGTPEVTGVLAGRCPWLTLGWDYPSAERFGDRVYEEYRAHPGLFRASSFATFGRELGERLARAWNLETLVTDRKPLHPL